jgi:hypothetical protein
MAAEELSIRNAAAFIVLVSCSFPAASQQISPMARYNRIAHQMYQLERCNEMTQERWEWLENERTHAMRAIGWDETLTQAHDDLLIADFSARYRAGIARERCEELARATDLERKSSAKVP